MSDTNDINASTNNDIRVFNVTIPVPFKVVDDYEDPNKVLLKIPRGLAPMAILAKVVEGVCGADCPVAFVEGSYYNIAFVPRDRVPGKVPCLLN